jgi:hypothetical protein
MIVERIRLLISQIIAIITVGTGVTWFIFDVMLSTKIVERFYACQIDNTLIVLSIGLAVIALTFLGFMVWLIRTPKMFKKENIEETEEEQNS